MSMNDDWRPNVQELRDYLGWLNANPGLSLSDYARIKMTPDLAIAVTKLFWPEFIEHEGGVFLADRFSQSHFEEWKVQLRGDISAVERVMNHQHLLDIQAIHTLGKENIAYFGRVLMQVWQCALRTQFPEREFEFSSEEDTEGRDFVFTFCQKRGNAG